MMRRPDVFMIPSQFQILDDSLPALPVDAELIYHTLDPYAIRVDFPLPNGDVDMSDSVTFGRELLADGLQAPAGEGAVRLRPEGDDWIRLDVDQPDRTLRFRVQREDLAALLGRSLTIRPPGQEFDAHEIDLFVSGLMFGPE